MAQGYFPRKWLSVWFFDRFDGDIEWFKERLSVPDEVKGGQNAYFRFHLETSSDFEVFKAALQTAYERATS